MGLQWEDSSRWPSTFIGIGTTGIGVCSWAEFRAAYIESVVKKDKSWNPSRITKGYGPMRSVNTFFSKLPSGKFFRKGVDKEESDKLEASFIQALRSEINY